VWEVGRQGSGRVVSSRFVRAALQVGVASVPAPRCRRVCSWNPVLCM